MAETKMPPVQNYNEIKKKSPENMAIRKPTLSRRLGDIFLVEDVDTVKQYVIFDVIIPGVKRVFLDALSMMLFGTTRSGGNKNAYVDYTRPGANRTSAPAESRATKRDYRDIAFTTRSKAEDCLMDLRVYLQEHGSVSVAYYCTWGDITPDWNDENRGWYDLSKVQVRTSQVIGADGTPCSGYYLDLPRPVVI